MQLEFMHFNNLTIAINSPLYTMPTTLVYKLLNQYSERHICTSIFRSHVYSLFMMKTSIYLKKIAYILQLISATVDSILCKLFFGICEQSQMSV